MLPMHISGYVDDGRAFPTIKKKMVIGDGDHVRVYCLGEKKQYFVDGRCNLFFVQRIHENEPTTNKFAGKIAYNFISFECEKG